VAVYLYSDSTPLVQMPEVFAFKKNIRLKLVFFCFLKLNVVADVCASKFSLANDLPAGLVVKAFGSVSRGPGSNPARDKNYHLWIEVVFH
jgi:hypothetical protein